jgi:transcriptional regulator with XRE-family HTH domain
MSKNKKTISEQLREAILEAPITRYEISKRSGVGESSLSRFIHGRQSLTLSSIDAIGDVLELQVVVRPAKKKGK